MKNDRIKVRLGEGSLENLMKVRQYLNIILPNWQEHNENDINHTDVFIGFVNVPSDDNIEPYTYHCPIDDIFKTKNGPIAFANELKLIAAQIWAQEG